MGGQKEQPGLIWVKHVVSQMGLIALNKDFLWETGDLDGL